MSGFNAKSASLMSMFRGTYMSIRAVADYPDTMVLSYTFARHLDPTKASAMLASQSTVLQAVCTTDFYKAMTSAGITTPHARFTYDNPDGSTIASYDCQ